MNSRRAAVLVPRKNNRVRYDSLMAKMKGVKKSKKVTERSGDTQGPS